MRVAGDWTLDFSILSIFGEPNPMEKKISHLSLRSQTKTKRKGSCAEGSKKAL
jgi:hypothetical protein